MNILGIDPATECGWALNTEGTIISGVWDLQRKNTMRCGDHPLLYLIDSIRKVEATASPDLIVFEAPIGYGSGMHPGRSAAGLLAGATKCGVIIAEAARIGCHWTSVSPSELKAFAKRHPECRDEFPQKGLGDKDSMFNAAKAFFHKVPADDNEADALWVCQWGYENYNMVLASSGQKGQSTPSGHGGV